VGITPILEEEEIERSDIASKYRFNLTRSQESKNNSHERGEAAPVSKKRIMSARIRVKPDTRWRSLCLKERG